MRPSVFALVVICSSACMHAQLPYNTVQVSTEQSIPITETGSRGIQLPEGTIIYVENDLRNLSSYSGSKLNWRVDVSSAVESAIPGHTAGLQAIRWLSCNGKELQVTCGKHCWATVQITDGAITLNGCD